MKRILIVCLLSMACGGSPCKEDDRQCNGDTVEVCDAFGAFHPVANCGDVGRVISVPLMCAYAGVPDGGYGSGNTCIQKPK